MAIANYSELSAAVLSWLDVESGQAGVTPARLADAAALVNARLRRMLVSVEGLSEATGTTTTTSNSTAIDVPAGFRAAYRMELLVDSDYIEIEELGCRLVFRYGALEIQPALTESYTYRLEYWGTLTALSGAEDTNWVLDNAPDVYLYGMLTHIGGFLGDERMANWASLFDTSMNELIELSNKMVGMRAFAHPHAGGGTP